MQVLLDHRERETDATSIAQAIAEAAVSLRPEGRVLVEVVVDGVPWDDDRLRSPEACSAGARQVQLVSEDVTTLIARILSDASAALLEADAQQRRAAELIQADRSQEAYGHIAEALDTWKAVHHTVVVAAEAMDLDLDAVRIGDEPMRESIEELSTHLRSLRSALETGDPVGLADTLLYELPEAVARWRGVLDALQQLLHEQE